MGDEVKTGHERRGQLCQRWSVSFEATINWERSPFDHRIGSVKLCRPIL
jgi:hypothetical protein